MLVPSYCAIKQKSMAYALIYCRIMHTWENAYIGPNYLMLCAKCKVYGGESKLG